jgi:hypothetical protein
MMESRVPNISKSLGLGLNSQLVIDEFGQMSNLPMNETLSDMKNVKSMPAVTMARTPRLMAERTKNCIPVSKLIGKNS